MKSAISFLVANFACFNLSSNIVLEHLLKLFLVVYLSWLGLFLLFPQFSCQSQFFQTNLLTSIT